MDLINILWLFIILASLQPAIQRRLLELSRQRALSRLASERGSTIVPHYAMSGGTLIALSADEIDVDPHAALGPVDPQLGEYPAASIVVAAEQAKDPDDRTLILADVSRKALWQVERFVSRLLEQSMKPARAADVAHILSCGTWTHDYPLEPEELEALGLPVEVGIPQGVHELMRLYPQPRGRQESVEYAPSPHRPREIPGSRPRD